ncbi:MAG: DedA family protein [Chloroflexi bacterium]|nr:DedA family protein [Chloroflexota bacterium]
MEWFTDVRFAVQSFLQQHGVLAAFVLILVEEAGIPVPVPGDFLMLGMGVQARQGRIPLWQALLAMEAATLVGATVLYLVSARVGRNLVYRYGRFMHLKVEHLERAEQWLQRHGALAIILGRLTPGLRMATVIACGVFAVPLWRFLPALGVGAFVYILLYTLLGYFVGARLLALMEKVDLPLGVVGSIALLAVMLIWIARAHRALARRPHPEVAGATDQPHRLRDGAVAGALATVVSALVMNILVHVAGDLALLAPGDIIQRTAVRLAVGMLARAVGPLLLVVAAPAFIAVGVFWGAVYAVCFEERLRWPDWTKGMLFALLPLFTAVLIVLPFLGFSTLGIGSAGLLIAAGETIRHLVYGIVLSLTYPLRLLQRPRRPIAPRPPDRAATELQAAQPV